MQSEFKQVFTARIKILWPAGPRYVIRQFWIAHWISFDRMVLRTSIFTYSREEGTQCQLRVSSGWIILNPFHENSHLFDIKNRL